MHVRVTQNLPVDVSTMGITAENSQKTAMNSSISISKCFDVLLVLDACMNVGHKLSRCRPDKDHCLVGQCAK